MSELVEEFNHSDYKRKLQILTLSPFTYRETAERFNTSMRQVRKSNALKNLHGILPEIPQMSRGKAVTCEMKLKVKTYETEEVSRICPGKKDFVIARDESGEKMYIQKRLLLGNLKELFEQYKSIDGNPEICFSTFASLRPPHCILAGGSGTHTVCVCSYHQNVKLQLAALGESGLTYKDLFDYAVCSTDNRDCMMHKCKQCDREVGVMSLLECLDSFELAEDFIKYKIWLTTDRCTLMDKIESLDEYIKTLSTNISKLTRHHDISSEQISYLKTLKSIIPAYEIIIIGDFSENYTYDVQDSIQGFYFVNAQCTIHPFVIYFKSEDQVQHQSYCFISDELKHDSLMVYAFISNLIGDLKSKHQILTKVHYFSDGCAGQYKNCYNLMNLCKHYEDFGIDAEWNFFATSHGKNACDGIGGLVKRSLSKASLQRPLANQILTSEAVFNHCNENLSTNIIFYHVSGTDINNYQEKLKDRFDLAQTVRGTRSFHKFVPHDQYQLKVFETSTDKSFDIRNITSKHISVNEVEVNLGNYVACIYNEVLWIGLVETYEEEFNDYLINFLYPQGIAKQYRFQNVPDKCYVPRENILDVLKTAKLTGGSRIIYSFNQEELNVVKKHASNFTKQI